MSGPLNGHTALLLKAAAVLVPLSLLLSAAASVGAVVTANRLEDERHDRCVNGRADTQAAIVAVVEEFRPDDVAMHRRVAGAVADELPTDEC